MSAPIALDVHAHLVPIVADRLQLIEGVNWDGAARAMSIDGHRIAMAPIFQPEALSAWMATNGVAHAFISAPPPLYRQHLRGTNALAWAAYINDGLHEIAASSGGTMTALVHLPAEAPDVAAAIADDWIGKGHAMFAMPAGTGDERTLGMPEFEPLWSVLDEGRAFVFVHPGECADGRLKSFYLTNLVGNPYESTVALAHLVSAGILERHPNMTVCFAHGGGMLPMVAGRLERGHATARPGVDTTLAPPSKLLPTLYADCICHSEAAAVHAEAVFGPDHIVFGSDWPFPMGLIEPAAQFAGYQPERLQRYFQTNPLALRVRLNAKSKS